VTKEQIFESSNKRAKEIMKSRTGEKIIKTSRRPNDVKFLTMCLLLIPGIFGVHNFYVGRKVRAWLMLSIFIVGLALALYFTPGTMANSFEDIHVARQFFLDHSPIPIFPTEMLIIAAILMWICDIVAIILGWYKYPVRLGESAKKSSAPSVDADRVKDDVVETTEPAKAHQRVKKK